MKKLKKTKKSEQVEDEDLEYLKKIIKERLKEIGVVIEKTFPKKFVINKLIC